MGDVIHMIPIPPGFWEPLKPLPKMTCYWCCQEIDGKPIWVERAWACHPGKCTRETRKLKREVREASVREKEKQPPALRR